MQEVGSTIKIIRRAKGLRVSHVAKEAGISNPFLSLVENGEREPSLSVLQRIAVALDVPFDCLVILAQSRRGNLHSADERAERIRGAVTRLVSAERKLLTILESESPSRAPE